MSGTPAPRLRDVRLADCPNCGHFQAWPYSDGTCDRCGWPDREHMKWRREFEAMGDPEESR